MDKSYSDLIMLLTFEQRFEYLKLDGVVGSDTFGHDRYLNQILYRTPEWKALRREIIIRDGGCDLAISDREIIGHILVHHINPITKEDILYRSSKVFDPENLITVSHNTHNAIHYGDFSLLMSSIITERTANDTAPWK